MKRSVLMLFAVGSVSAQLFASAPSVVRLERHGEGWRLLRNAQPFFIKGAVGWSHLESKDHRAVIQLPAQAGKHRVFVYVRDGKGGAATANAPLLTR